MDKFNFQVAVAGASLIQQPGRYVYYRKATAGLNAPEIQVKSDQGDVVKLLPGEGYTFDTRFSSVMITNSDAASTIAGQVIVGDGIFQANRVQGEVSVVDGSKARSLSGDCFSCLIGTAAVAGQYSHAQLWNPLASGKNIALEYFVCSLPVVKNLYLATYNVALALSASVPTNKMINSVRASVAEVRYQNNAAILSTTLLQYVEWAAADVPYEHEFKRPVIIPPGFGVQIIDGIVNQALHVGFEFVEDAI